MDKNIPRISNDIEIMPFDNGGYLVHHKKLGYRININTITYQLLNLVDGKLTIEEIIRAFKQRYEISLKKENVLDILHQKLAKYHIIENEHFEYKPKEKPSYLKLSFTAVKKDWIDGIVSKMGFLFSKKIFYPTLFAMVIFMAFVILININTVKSDLATINTANGSLYFLIFGIVVVLHELGHAAACNKFGAKHGDIGFGFYLLSPVMYADVSDAWKLKKSERIIVNLGGIYIQLIIASIFACIYLITNNNFLLIPAFSIGGLSILYNLNPFFRTDGYWVLSDYVGIANLRENSNIALISFIKRKVNTIDNLFSLKNILLALYALISIGFIFVFLFVILIQNPNSIFNYPYNFIQYIKLVFTTQEIHLNELQTLILPTLFFIILFRFLVRLYKTKISSLSRVEKKESIILGVKIILATVFFLSAVGKTLSFTSFSRNINEFVFIPHQIIPYGILLIEYSLAIGFMTFIFSRQIAKISFVFLILMTISYSYGHFILDIKKCGCFGYFKFLTPSNYFIYIVKNVSLIIACLYILKYTKNITINRRLLKTTISIFTVFVLSFLAYKTEVKFIRDFAKTNIGKVLSNILPEKDQVILKYSK